MSDTATSTCSPGASRIVRDLGAASPPGMTVTVASIDSWERLATMTVSSAAPSGVDVPAAQYQAFEMTSAGGTPTPVRAATSAAATAVDDSDGAFCCATTAAASATTT